MDLSRRLAIILCLLSGAAPLSAHTVSGKISVSPPFPEAKVIQITDKHKKTCGDITESQRLKISKEGDLKNALVYLEGDLEVSSGSQGPLEAKVIDQLNCHYDPHMILLQPNQELRVKNSDPMDHDVRAFDGAEMLFRFEIDYKGKPVNQHFEKPGIYLLRCGLHPWMHAYVVQAAHPFYALTDESGNFSLEAVPEGKYRLKIWHEFLGQKEIPLEVSQSKEGLRFIFEGKGNNA